jgi:hypothetical protein
MAGGDGMKILPSSAMIRMTYQDYLSHREDAKPNPHLLTIALVIFAIALLVYANIDTEKCPEDYDFNESDWMHNMDCDFQGIGIFIFVQLPILLSIFLTSLWTIKTMMYRKEGMKKLRELSVQSQFPSYSNKIKMNDEEKILSHVKLVLGQLR